MKDLGYTPPKREKDEVAASPVNDQESPQYPSLRFNGEQASKAGLTKCELGETYELTIHIKAIRIDAHYTSPGSGDSKGKPKMQFEMQFDVLACDDPKEIDGKEAEKKQMRG